MELEDFQSAVYYMSWGFYEREYIAANAILAVFAKQPIFVYGGGGIRL